MQYNRLTLRNFGPFKGQQDLEFARGSHANITMVFGENMRGKTSLLNALRWLLMGEAVDRHMKELDLFSRVLNWEARADEDFRVEVALEFEWNSDRYQLSRLAEPRELVAVPRSSHDFVQNVMLRKNGDLLPKEEVQHSINMLMPRDVARFYLFDGELLQEYELLLHEDNTQSTRIKAAIESVLGVPALVSGREELATLLKKAQARFARDSSQVKQLEEQAKESLRLQEEIAAHETDLVELQGRYDGLRSEIDEIDDELNGQAGAQELLGEIRLLQRRQTDAGMKQDQLKTERLALIEDAWIDLLQPRLDVRKEELESVIASFEAQMKSSGALEHQASNLRALLGKSECPLCDQVIADGSRERFGEMLGNIEIQLGAQKGSYAIIASVNEELRALSRLTPRGSFQSLKNSIRDMTRLDVELTSIESELAVLQDKLGQVDTARLALLRVRRDGHLTRLGELQVNISDVKRQIEQKVSKYRQISKLMSRTTTAQNKRSAKEVQVLGALEGVFNEGVGLLRDKLRSRVEAKASEVFRQLTTEGTYRGLQINSNYGLHIVDRNGTPVTVRSAGAEQVVAFSLICALNTISNRAAPVVIDTPIARLDTRHRQNILKYLTNLAEQVVFLVHSGEVDRERDLNSIRDRIGRIYTIQRVTSSCSRIEEERI